MDILSLLNKDDDRNPFNPPSTSQQRPTSKRRDAFQGCNHGVFPSYHTSLVSQSVASMPSSVLSDVNWSEASRVAVLSEMPRRSTTTSNVCAVHSRWWISGVTCRPADDAAIIYLSESIRGSPRIAIQLALGRGYRFTVRRRDMLHGYQPERSCLNCHYVEYNLRRAR